MNNKIYKFRAWDKEEKKMFYFDNLKYFNNYGEVAVGAYNINSDNKECDYIDVDGGEEEGLLMQYTGLKDKNGKEIYEGDIVENTLINPQLLECYCANEIIGSVGYAFQFRKLPNDTGMTWRWETTDIQIIGNIYENPELLKKLNK